MVSAIPFAERHCEVALALLHTCGLNIGLELFRRHFLEAPPCRWPDTEGPLKGLVLVDGERVVGFLGLVGRELYCRENALPAYEMGALGISPAYRLYAPLLMRQLDRQREAHAFYSNTANAQAVRMFHAAGFQDGCATNARICFRVFNWHGLLRNAARMHPRIGSLPGWLVGGLGSMLNAGQPVAHPLPRPRSGSVGRSLTSVDPALFDDFWNRVLETNRGLISSRQPAVLEWLFGADLRGGKAMLLTRLVQNRLAGYLVLRQRPLPAPGTFRYVVADWIAVDHDSAILGDLLRDACIQARADGATLIEMIGYPDNIQNLVARFLPRHRPVAANPFIFKVTGPMPAADFRREADAGWFWGPFDADRCVVS
jgi:hypothetical protein